MRTRVDSIGLNAHLTALGIDPQVIDAIMRNPIIIAKGAAIARAIGKTHPTGKRYADLWLKEHKQETNDEKENGDVDNQVL